MLMVFHKYKLKLIGLFYFFFLNYFNHHLFAQGIPDMSGIDLGAIANQGFSESISLLVAMSVISLVPFFFVTTTSFLRIIIVFGMLRMALATQQSPPNIVLLGLAMFLTVFIMTPTINTVIDTAITPLQSGLITQKEAMTKGVKPFRDFMLNHTQENDLALLLEFSKVQYTDSFEEVPIFVIIPAFILSELKTAFQIGFLLFLPFLVIDMVIASVLMSLGMMMLSPMLIALPFKLLLFVLVDGWAMTVGSLVGTFS